MFVTDDEEMLNKARSLWSFGESRAPSQNRDYHVYAMGWMYRNNDLTASFGRSQLKKLDRNLAAQRENAEALIEGLRGTPNLILPTETPGATHNWYNYTLRFDMEKLGHAHDAAEFRNKINAAIVAEGAPTGVWQAYILPAMTVFQAKNGYGHGCPWACQWSKPVDYALEQYPQAQRHTDSHTGMTVPLRHPNGVDAAKATARAIRKVMENAGQIQ